jgi:hypothetical protein
MFNRYIMSSTVAKFGELSIKPSSLELNDDDDGVGGGNLSNNESDDLQNGFSNIDLNGSNSPSIENFKQPSINSNFTNNSSLGYTSFGETLLNDNNNNTINNNPNMQMIKSATTQYKISNNNTTTTLTSNIDANTNSYDGFRSMNESTSLPFSTSFSNGNGMSMLSTASDASANLALKTVSTLELLKQWSVSAYKCTRQIVNEKLGKSNRTVDPELDASIDVILLFFCI